MAGRWSVWHDPQIQNMARRLVPAADEVWRLQRSDDPEASFFQTIADHGHYRREGGTRQGIYVITPGGKLLSSINSLHPVAVRDALERGLAAWDALDQQERDAAPPEAYTARSRWEDAYPKYGLVLRVTMRDLPGHAHDPRVERYNLDHVWVGKDEVDASFPAQLAVGDVVEWPRLAQRLARFHLVDAALGQTLPYAPEEILNARVTLTVTSVEGTVATMDVTGESEADADGVWKLGDNDWMPEQEWPRTMSAKLVGTAVFDFNSRRFDAFNTIAVGKWTGKTRFNGRADQEDGRIGYILEQAPDIPTERVAPAFVDVYEMPWVDEAGSQDGMFSSADALSSASSN